MTTEKLFKQADKEITDKWSLLENPENIIQLEDKEIQKYIDSIKKNKNNKKRAEHTNQLLNYFSHQPKPYYEQWLDKLKKASNTPIKSLRETIKEIISKRKKAKKQAQKIFQKSQKKNYEPSKKLSEPNQEELKILTDTNLLEKINKEFDKKIVGEEDNRKSIFLNACGKWVKNSNIASYNLCINSNSGAGKDYIVKNVLKILPQEEVVIRTRITPTVFTYWHNAKFEPEWTWDNKALLLSDISNSILNHEVFKLMCSDGTYSTVVINQQAIDIIINGKPVMFTTTASANPKNELLRRFPILELDESIDQTKQIKKRQALAAVRGESIEYDPKITHALRKLKRIKVKILYAETLVEFFPDDHIIMRTHFNRLLDYIKASAALHQYQRKTDEEGFVIATTQDYDIATIPLKATTSNPFMIPLTKKQKMLLEKCKELNDFSVKELEPTVPFLVQSKIYEALGKLQELGFLSSYTSENPESKRSIRKYVYIDFKINKIPLWKNIEEYRIKGITETKGKEEIKETKGMILPIPSKNQVLEKKSPSTFTYTQAWKIVESHLKEGEYSVDNIKSSFSKECSNDIDKLIDKWKQEGLIFEHKPGRLRLV